MLSSHRSALRRITALSLSTVTLSTALVVAAGVTEVAATPAAGACQSVTALTNGGFEQPELDPNSMTFAPTASVPGWSSSQPEIEIWNTYGGVPAAAGSQYAELNAHRAGTLYQDVATMPGQSLQWSLQHRARQGTDVMDVLIGTPSGDLVSQGALSDTTAAWGQHDGVYVVPAGQTVTRFGFRAVSTGSGNESIGNFLDDISFGTGPCVVMSSAVDNITSPGGIVRVGDMIRYTVSATNEGGSPALVAELTDQLPAGVEFVPGSIVVDGVAASDVADSDAAELTAPSTVIARLGSDSSLAPQQRATLVFHAVVTASAALSRLVHTPTLAFTDPLTNARSQQAGPVTTTPVAAASDLVVTQTVNTATPVAGDRDRVVFTSQIANAGPQDATDVTALVAIPTGLIDPAVEVSGVPCTISDGIALCAVGDLAVGATRTLVVSGRVAETTEAGTPFTSTVSASSAVYDPSAANASAITTATSTTAGDLWVTAGAADETIAEGELADFLIEVGNDGPSAARDVAVALTMPEGMTLDASDGTFADGVWSIPVIAAGETRTVRLRSTALALGAAEAAASVTSASLVRNPSANDRAVASVFVERAATVPALVVPAPIAAAPYTQLPSIAFDEAAPVVAAAVLASTGAAGVGEAALGGVLLLLLGGLLLVTRRGRGRHARR